MIPIILKIILCSGILLSLYYLFLEREKTFVFNRFYLLSALLFSFCIPFANIKIKQPEKVNPTTVFDGNIEEALLQAPIAVQQKSLDFTEIFLMIYFAVSGILIFKILYSLIKIKTLKGRKIIYKNRNVFLLKKNIAPFSFLSTIYLSENYFKESKIENAIFLHEEIHVKQKHSLDILFVEVLKAVFWLNPFIYFYKKAMINNHEFIADEGVIARNKNIKNYQELILNEIIRRQNLNLTHQFNFNNTKKRFIMMTSKNSKFAKAKRYFAIPAFAVLAIIFAEKTYAKENVENINIVNSIKTTEKTLIPENFKKDIPKNDVKTLKTIETKNIKPDTIKPKRDEEFIKGINNKSNSEFQKPASDNISSNTTNPEYPGGINQLRNKIAANFNGAVLTGNEGLIKSELYFSIDKEGNAKEFSATGTNEKFNNEATRAAKIANENIIWKPATKDGEPIVYRFKLPLTMIFETGKKTQ